MADKNFSIDVGRMLGNGLVYGTGRKWDTFPHEGLDEFILGAGEVNDEQATISFWVTCDGGPADGLGSRSTLFTKGDGKYGKNEETVAKFLAALVSYENPKISTDEELMVALAKKVDQLTDGGKTELTSDVIIEYATGKKVCGVHKVKEIKDKRDGTVSYKTNVTSFLPRYRFMAEKKPHKPISPYMEAQIAAALEAKSTQSTPSTGSSQLRSGTVPGVPGNGGGMDVTAMLNKLGARTS